MDSIPPPDPLSSFTRLSPSVYLYEPLNPHIPPSAAVITTPPPSTIILLSWMSASPIHIAKYIKGHQTLFPSSRILLLRTPLSYITHVPNRLQKDHLSPAITAIQADPAKILYIHLFSNGGAHTLVNLATAYLQKTGSKLPIRAMLLDSSPDRPDLIRGGRALLPTNPLLRPLLLFLVYLLFFLTWLTHRPFGRKNIIDRARAGLNDAALVRREAVRCYIYSKEDEMVSWENVEEHAAEAEGRGWRVRRELFVGSGHVAHARVDSGRYWGVVQRVWESRDS